MSEKQKYVHGRGPFNLHLGLFVSCFDVYRDSKPVPSYVLTENFHMTSIHGGRIGVLNKEMATILMYSGTCYNEDPL